MRTGAKVSILGHGVSRAGSGRPTWRRRWRPTGTCCDSTRRPSTPSTSTPCPTGTRAPTWRSRWSRWWRSWPARRASSTSTTRPPDAPVGRRRRRDAGPAMAAVCKAVAHGSLMGARGNSGVILSPAAAGPHRRAGRGGRGRRRARRWPRGLAAASDAARQAVLRPVEGTILTVARAAAEGAERRRRRRRHARGRGRGVAPRPRPRRWHTRPSSCPSWPRRAWSTPAGRGTSCCSTPP